MVIGKIVTDLRDNNLWGEAEDYVNDGYVKCIEAGEVANFINLYKHSRQSMHKGRVFLVRKDGEFAYQHGTTKVCAYCREDLPIGFFGITNRTDVDFRTIQPYCRDCAKKYFKEYVIKDREQWNAYLRERYKYDRDNLTDAFIKKYLRCYGWKTDKITPQVISYKRRELKEKRMIA